MDFYSLVISLKLKSLFSFTNEPFILYFLNQETHPKTNLKKPQNRFQGRVFSTWTPTKSLSWTPRQIFLGIQFKGCWQVWYNVVVNPTTIRSRPWPPIPLVLCSQVIIVVQKLIRRAEICVIHKPTTSIN